MDGGNPMQRQSTLDKAVAAGQIPKWRKWFHISFDPFKVPKVRGRGRAPPPLPLCGALTDPAAAPVRRQHLQGAAHSPGEFPGEDDRAPAIPRPLTRTPPPLVPPPSRRR